MHIALPQGHKDINKCLPELVGTTNTNKVNAYSITPGDKDINKCLPELPTTTNISKVHVCSITQGQLRYQQMSV
jgi:hypothetical protein